MTLSAIAVLSIVGGAIGFNSASCHLGDVWCARDILMVNPNIACSSQPGLTEIFFNVGGGLTTNPCPGSEAPYDGAILDESNSTSGHLVQADCDCFKTGSPPGGISLAEPCILDWPVPYDGSNPNECFAARGPFLPCRL